jgi:Response regulator of the LytR/AlgR family
MFQTKIAICDDDLRDIETIRSHVISHKNQHDVFEFNSGKTLLEKIHSNEHFDLLFLDVQMPDSDGWSIAEYLKKSKTKLFVAMVTVMGEYINECFNRVDWFAEKPITKEKTHKIIDIAYEKLYPNALVVQTIKGTKSLTVPEIFFLEADRNNINIHTTNGIWSTRSTLKEINEKLSNTPSFARIHNGVIINLQYLDMIDGNDAVLKNGRRLPISRNGRKTLFDELNKYIGGA